MAQTKQFYFEWGAPSVTGGSSQMQLDPDTAEVVIALVTRALVAVVRAAQEIDDEQ